MRKVKSDPPEPGRKENHILCCRPRFPLTGSLWQTADLPIVLESDGELDNESDLHHRESKINRRLFRFNLNLNLTRNCGWPSIQIERKDKKTMINSDDTRNNVQVNTQSAVIRSDSLSWHSLSSSSEESAIASDSAAALQSLEILYDNLCPLKSRSEASTASKMMNDKNSQNSEVFDIVSHHFRKRHCFVSAFSDETKELTNESCNKPLRFFPSSFTNNNLAQKNDINKAAHKRTKNRSDDDEDHMESDSNCWIVWSYSRSLLIS